MGFFEGVGGIGDSLFGGDRARDEAKAARERGKNILGIKDESNYDRSTLFGARDNYRKLSNLAIRRGYKNASQHLEGQGEAAIRDAKDRGAATEAGMQQSMIDRGLTNTTVLDNASRGISSDVSRQIADIREGLGRMRADLALSKMGTVLNQLDKNLLQKEKTAWDWFKFTVGGAGFAPGESNAFGFQGSPYSQPRAYDGIGSQFGGFLDDNAETMMKLMGKIV